MTAGLSLMKNALTPLAEKVLLPLGLAAVASAANATVQNKILDLALQHEELDDIMKILKSFEEASVLIKGVNETIKNK